MGWWIATALQWAMIVVLWRRNRSVVKDFWAVHAEAQEANELTVKTAKAMAELVEAAHARSVAWEDIAARQRDAAFMAAKERDAARVERDALLSRNYSQN